MTSLPAKFRRDSPGAGEFWWAGANILVGPGACPGRRMKDGWLKIVDHLLKIVNTSMQDIYIYVRGEKNR